MSRGRRHNVLIALDPRQCRQLAVMVLLQAVKDVRRRTRPEPGCGFNHDPRVCARGLLLGEGPYRASLELWCALADLNPDAITGRMEGILQQLPHLKELEELERLEEEAKRSGT
jgi:hypothetical protein